jgi:hypothetical protein
MKKVVINRSQWLRGRGKDDIDVCLWHLQHNHGCCLGHVLHQAHGVSYADMHCISEPRELAILQKKNNPLAKPDGFYHDPSYINTTFAVDAMSMNDNSEVSELEREARIIEILGKQGYQIEFIG